MNISRYIRTFKYWPLIFFNVYRKNFDFWVEYRDGRKVKVLNQEHLYFLSFSPGNLQYDQNSDILSFNFIGNSVKFKGALNNGDIGSIFGEACYDVEVHDKTVLDIGANIGDSSVFFALRGASRVIAFEPSYANFETLQENVHLNDLDTKIITLHNGVSAKDCIIKLPINISGGNIKALNNKSTEGIDIEMISIEKVIHKYNPQVIKIDCEGCEHEIFDDLSVDLLRKIETITGEYHDKEFDIINKKLRNAGFETIYQKHKPTGLFTAYRK